MLSLGFVWHIFCCSPARSYRYMLLEYIHFCINPHSHPHKFLYLWTSVFGTELQACITNNTSQFNSPSCTLVMLGEHSLFFKGHQIISINCSPPNHLHQLFSWLGSCTLLELLDAYCQLLPVLWTFFWRGMLSLLVQGQWTANQWL